MDDAKSSILSENSIFSSHHTAGFIPLQDVARVLNRCQVRFVLVAGGVGLEYTQSWRGQVKSILGLPYDNLVRMQREVHRLDLSEHFVFTGHRNDIPELLTASDIVAFLPQTAEGFGRPLIEGMAAARPLVATDIGPTREIVGEGTAILVPTGDAGVVTRAILTLLEDQQHSQALGAQGRKRVNQCFGMEQYIDRITRVYERVMKKTESVVLRSSVCEEHELKGPTEV